MLKQYSSYFVSYLLNNLKNIGNIKRIILYGSVARSDEDKESDIDIFIEIKIKNKKFENEIKKLEKEFYQSREASLFKLKNIDNEFSIKIGKLEEWKDLQRSIASTGIVLYGDYQMTELPKDIKHSVIIYWNKIGKNRGAFLNKLYGFHANKKYYQGLLDKFDGKKIGKSCIMIPIQYKMEIFNLLENYKVEAKTREVFIE
ncbi:nucleotidyltransferase domain-containing protein [Candidatus Woesearchaeota archaeon]|nr:nucleotidyltransferase domain-containing protein [Candidatus Woesearchaeota archaeon]